MVSNEWVKASKSASSGQCLEMRRVIDGIDVRDSKHPHDATLSLTLPQCGAWLAAARNGEFDHLLTT